MSHKRHNPSDHTAKDALAELEGRVKDGQLSPIAEELQARARRKAAHIAANNERIRRARALAELAASDDDVA